MTRWLDRLLPFEFIVVHTPGRTLGMADYLSRHSSPYSGAVIKSEQMFNDWFTINVVNEFAKELDQATTAKVKKTTKRMSRAISQSEARTHVITVFEQNESVLQTTKVNKSVRIERQANSEIIAANSRISRVYVQANYEKDKQLQKTIDFSKTAIRRNLHAFPLPGGKSFTPLASIRMIYYTLMNVSYPKGYQRKHANSNSFWTRGQRHHAEKGSRRLVSQNTKGNC